MGVDSRSTANEEGPKEVGEPVSLDTSVLYRRLAFNFTTLADRFMKSMLRSFDGSPRKFVLINRKPIVNDLKPEVTPSHDIWLIDCSGSMSWDIETVRSEVVKVATLQDFAGREKYVSVISYASSGDVVVHFDHIRVEDVMTPGSKYEAAIRNLRTRGCTCGSQALKIAIGMIRSNEVTAITLHTDGYFNDRSPGEEMRQIDQMAAQVKAMPNAFVNTIAYGGYSDFTTLSRIANDGGGTCFRAPRAKDVFTALETAAKAISGTLVPATIIPKGDADYSVFVSLAARKVLGSAGDIKVVGIPDGSDQVAIQYRYATKEEYDASSEPESDASQEWLALAAGYLAEGRLNDAKYALVSARAEGILRDGGRAITGPQIAALAADIENAILTGSLVQSKGFGMPGADRASVLKVLSVMSRFTGDIEVDVSTIAATYRRRGTRKMAGKREKDGTITQPRAKRAFRNGGRWGQVSAFELNRDTATINMRVTRPIDVIRLSDGQLVKTAGGLDLSKQTAFNNYTIVADGSLNLDKIPCLIRNEVLHRRLVALGVLPDNGYDVNRTYVIDLDGRPLIGFDASFDASVISGFVDRVAPLMAVSSIFRALMTGKSDERTDEQISELAALHISPAGYFGPPSCEEYDDLEKALEAGTVDSYVKFHVTFGSRTLLNVGELPSANAFLARRFTVSVDGVSQDKPKVPQFWENWSVGVKTLGPKIKLTQADTLLFPIYSDFLGMSNDGSFGKVLSSAGAEAGLVNSVYKALRGGLSTAEKTEAFRDAQRLVDNAIDASFDSVSQIVFYIGATGLLPDAFGDVQRMNAEKLEAACPTLKLGKAEKDGSFFLVGDTVVSIFPETAYFSKGSKVADADLDE